MASTQISASAMEIADSLNQADIPIKFRCAICGRLALNAVRLPCCDQNICDKCQSTLPEACPICAHSPLSPDAAKPLKALRLTVLAFLKSVEKKREKERAATESASHTAETSSVPATPSTAIDPKTAADPTTFAASVVESSQADALEAAPPSVAPDVSEAAQGDAGVDMDLDLDYSVEQSIEEVPPYQIDTQQQGSAEPSTDRVDADEDEDDLRSVAASDETEIVTGDEVQYDDNGNRIYPAAEEEAIDEQFMSWMLANADHDQSQAFSGGYDPNGGQPNFPHMPWNGAQNPAQAQMMQQMQMQNGGWGGNANMMGGMPTMPGMTPMDMQTMMAQFGMGGMNPAMMNMMGMNGMGGMNGMMGMDFSGGGFDGWNNGQQMSGGYGASNGFYPAGGFNQSHQGQFPQMSHHQQYPKNNFHNQNRFQGPQRGGYGRGYHNQGNGSFHQQQQQQQQFQNQSSGPPPGAPKGPKGAQGGFQGNSDAFHHQLPQKVQSRRSSQVMSVDKQPFLKESVQQNNESGEAQDENTTVKPAPDSLDTLDPSDKDVSGSGTAGNTNDSEQTQHEYQVESGAVAHEQAPDLADNSKTDQPQLGQVQGSIASQADTASASNVEDHSNTTITEQTNGHSNYGQGNHLSQSHDFQHQLHSNQQSGWGSFRGRGSQDMRGGFRGRGGPNWQYHGTHGPSQGEGVASISVEPIGTGVQGAPKGPKAMREGLPNTGWSGRSNRGGFGSPARGGSNVPASPMAPHTSDIAASQAEKAEPERARSRSKSRSRSRTRTPRRHRSRNDRSRTPSSESGYDQKRDSRRHRSSRKHEGEDANMTRSNSKDHDDGNDRSRDKDRHRSSKSHRDSSRRRHRRRSRSRSPARADEADAASREDKPRDKYRDRSRDREREERDRDRRDRDKKRSRRDRSESRDSDHHHRSSRRSKKDKDRERDRDHEPRSARSSQPQTPIEPDVEFKFQGRSKDRLKPTPTGPAAMQPPTGPRTQLPTKNQIKLNLSSAASARPIPTPKTASSRHSQPPTPTSTAASLPPTPTSTITTSIDPYQQEREARIRERERKEEQRRASLHGSGSSASRKRSLDDVGAGFEPPTGPRGAGGSGGGKRVKDAGGKSRRVNYKYEDEVDGVRREREREGGRL